MFVVGSPSSSLSSSTHKKSPSIVPQEWLNQLSVGQPHRRTKSVNETVPSNIAHSPPRTPPSSLHGYGASSHIHRPATAHERSDTAKYVLHCHPSPSLSSVIPLPIHVSPIVRSWRSIQSLSNTRSQSEIGRSEAGHPPFGKARSYTDSVDFGGQGQGPALPSTPANVSVVMLKNAPDSTGIEVGRGHHHAQGHDCGQSHAHLKHRSHGSGSSSGTTRFGGSDALDKVLDSSRRRSIQEVNGDGNGDGDGEIWRWEWGWGWW